MKKVPDHSPGVRENFDGQKENSLISNQTVNQQKSEKQKEKLSNDDSLSAFGGLNAYAKPELAGKEHEIYKEEINKKYGGE